MFRVNMTLSYQVGDESVVLQQAKELYKEWNEKADPANDLTIDIRPGL